MTWVVRDRRGRTLAVLTWGSVAVGAAEVGSLLTMVGLAMSAAPHGELWPAVVVIALAAVAVALPDSAAGLLTLLGYGAWWLIADRHAPWPATLVAALAALVLHVALAHAAAAPAGAVTRAAVAWALAGELGLVAAATSLAALAAAVLARSGWRAPPYLIGVALVLVGLVPWVALDAGSREARRR